MTRLVILTMFLAGALFLCSCGEEKRPFVVPNMIPTPNVQIPCIYPFCVQSVIVQTPCVCDGQNCWGDCY